jgi:hypothetical protein
LFCEQIHFGAGHSIVFEQFSTWQACVEGSKSMLGTTLRTAHADEPRHRQEAAAIHAQEPAG